MATTKTYVSKKLGIEMFERRFSQSEDDHKELNEESMLHLPLININHKLFYVKC